MLTGLILAGGPDPRMDGERKALLSFGGETLIQRQIKEMRKLCTELIVAAKDPKPFLRIVDPDVRLITDYYPDQGPLGGIHAGFTLARCPNIWVAGSDMPFISASAAELLLERKLEGFEATLPHIGGRLHPLHGIYDRRCVEPALALLGKGERRVSELLQLLFWFELPEAAFTERGVEAGFVDTIETRDDYHHALGKLANAAAS